jgi:hypothetical protein
VPVFLILPAGVGDVVTPSGLPISNVPLAPRVKFPAPEIFELPVFRVPFIVRVPALIAAEPVTDRVITFPVPTVIVVFDDKLPSTKMSPLKLRAPVNEPLDQLTFGPTRNVRVTVRGLLPSDGRLVV